LNPEHFAPEADGFVTAEAKFTFAAEEVGLHGDVFADVPTFDSVADGANLPGDFSAGCARKGDWNWQATFFKPEIETVQTAGLDLHNNLVRAGL
jgi:hypothetical protein